MTRCHVAAYAEMVCLCQASLLWNSGVMESWLSSRDIPADVCQQCGDGLLSPEVSRKLEQFFSERHNWQPEKYLTVPQYSATQFMEDS